MTGKLTKIERGARFFTYHFITEEGRGFTYAVPGFRNFTRWSRLKEEQDVKGLRWANTKTGLIDADSPVKVVQVELAV